MVTSAFSGVNNNHASSSSGYFGRIWCFLWYIVATFILNLFSQCVYVTAQVVDTEIGIVNSYIGESATLLCDLRNIYDSESIIWYHNDRGRYISYDENLFSDVPTELRDRVSVVCGDGVEDTCSLTITNLTVDDNGTYSCGYGYISGSEGVKFLISGSLIVTYGTPPSAESPTCSIFILENEHYIPKMSEEEYTVGETIFLQCSASGGTPKPSIEWRRNNVTIGIPTKGLAVFHEVKLAEADIGVVFICVVTHPALSDPRFCSLTPLPVLSTLPTSISPITTTRTYMSAFSKSLPLVVSTKTSRAITNNSTMSKPSISLRTQPYIVPAISAAVMIAIICVIVGVVLFLICRNRKQKSVIPRKPDYELTFDRVDCSITPDLAAVNAPDSLDKARELRSGSESETCNPLLQDPIPSSDNTNEDTFPVYAKPDKKRKIGNGAAKTSEPDGQYENLPHHLGDKAEEDTPNGTRLTYAELDFPVISDSNSRIPKFNKDATIYARIEDTL